MDLLVFEATDYSTIKNALVPVPCYELTEVLRAETTQEINEGFELEFEILASDPFFSSIQNNRLIRVRAFPWSGSSVEFQYFRIYSIQKNINRVVTVKAQHLVYDLAKVPVLPFNVTGTLNQIISAIESNMAVATEISIVNRSSAAGTYTFNLTAPATARQCLGGMEGSIRDLTGLYLDYDNDTIYLADEDAITQTATVNYGEDIQEMSDLLDNSSYSSGVLGYAVVDEKLFVGNVSQPGGAITYPKIEIVDFSEKYSADNLPTVASLTTDAQNYATSNKLSTAKETISATIIDLLLTDQGHPSRNRMIGVGDKIRILDSGLGIDKTERIMSGVYDVLTKKYKDFELGASPGSLNDMFAPSGSGGTNAGKVPAIGDVIITSTNTDPSTRMGGTWTLIDKGYKTTGEVNHTSDVTVTTGNCSACNVHTKHDGHTIEFWIRVTTSVSLADTAVSLATISTSAIGADKFPDARRITFLSDAGDALISFYLSASGELSSNDAFTLGTSVTHSVAARQLDYFSVTVQMNMEDMIDAWCDKFYWKRTA